MKKLIAAFALLLLAGCGSGSSEPVTPGEPAPQPEVVKVEDVNEIVAINVLEKWPVDSEEIGIAHLQLVTPDRVRKVWWCKYDNEIKIGDKLIEQPETEEGYEDMTGIYINGNLVDLYFTEKGDD